jgi:hypothetical protein
MKHKRMDGHEFKSRFAPLFECLGQYKDIKRHYDKVLEYKYIASRILKSDIS